MAVIKMIPLKGSIKNIMDYLKKDGRADQMISSFDCPYDEIHNKMNETKELYNHKVNDKRVGYHLIQSFSPEDKITPEQANKIAFELVEAKFPNLDFAIITHNDKGHIHNHIVLNNIVLEDMDFKHRPGNIKQFKEGQKFNYQLPFYEEVKQYSDKLCIDNNLNVIMPDINSKSLSKVDKILLEKKESKSLDITSKIQKIIKETVSNDNIKSFDDVKKLSEEYNLTFNFDKNRLSFTDNETGKNYSKRAVAKFCTDETIQILSNNNTDLELFFQRENLNQYMKNKKNLKERDFLTDYQKQLSKKVQIILAEGIVKSKSFEEITKDLKAYNITIYEKDNRLNFKFNNLTKDKVNITVDCPFNVFEKTKIKELDYILKKFGVELNDFLFKPRWDNYKKTKGLLTPEEQKKSLMEIRKQNSLNKGMTLS